MFSTPLMSVQTAGIKHVANLFSGPEELVRRDMASLAAVMEVLDRYSLMRQRALTLPLVREALSQEFLGGQARGRCRHGRQASFR